MKKSQKVLAPPSSKAREKALVSAAEPFLTALRVDHADCSRILSLLSREANQLSERPRDALCLIREALRFITVHLDACHHPREDVLFEHLARRSRRLERALQALHREHERGAQLGRRLAAQVEQFLSVPRNASRLETLQDEIEQFVDHQRDHIGDEERVLYSSALDSLSAFDWRAIESAAPRYDTRSGLSNARAYPLLARYFNSSAPHHMVASSGTMQRLGIHRASEAYGHVVGHAIEACWIAVRQNREAFRLASQSLRAVCTPRSLPAYTKAVRVAYRTDVDTLARWTDEWRTHLSAAQYNVRSLLR